MAMNFDVAYMEWENAYGGMVEVDSDWADTLEEAIKLGDSADCQGYVIWNCDSVMHRTTVAGGKMK